MNPGGSPVDAAALVALRGDMLRFARLQLRDAATAEDLVQESIEAALRNAAGFDGRSALKTWVFTILRNRIVDHLRKARRIVPMSSLVEDGDDWQRNLASYFDQTGHWHAGPRPVAWPAPDAAMRTRQFWAVFEACLDHLPANTARVFMMREFLGFESHEICSQLGITMGNCHVILHRARMRLRGCLETEWGRPEGEGC